MKKALNEYLNEYQKNIVNLPKVHIFIPKDRNGKYCIKPNCRWYVYFYYYENRERKIYKAYKNINRIKTLSGRMQAAKNLKKAIEYYLKENSGRFSTYKKNDILTFSDALQLAYEQKKIHWSSRTERNNFSYLNNTLYWLEQNSIEYLPIKLVEKHHIHTFLSDLKQRGLTNTSINNYRRFISALFTVLSKQGYINYNFIINIDKLKETPQKNKTFDLKQLQNIKIYIKNNDTALYYYLQFLTFTFLRPIEINRLKVKDINLDKRIIYVKTKTEQSIVPIIDKLLPTIEYLNIKQYQPDDILLTYKGYPFDWKIGEKARYDNFAVRFKKVKRHFNLGNEYGIYSFRHTFAKMLYNKYLADGLTDLQAKQKLMTITRHKSISSLNKYLRNIGAFVPKDYSDDFTFDF